jgi:hypothetical protein
MPSQYLAWVNCHTGQFGIDQPPAGDPNLSAFHNAGWVFGGAFLIKPPQSLCGWAEANGHAIVVAMCSGHTQEGQGTPLPITGGGTTPPPSGQPGSSCERPLYIVSCPPPKKPEEKPPEQPQPQPEPAPLPIAATTTTQLQSTPVIGLAFCDRLTSFRDKLADLGANIGNITTDPSYIDPAAIKNLADNLIDGGYLFGAFRNVNDELMVVINHALGSPGVVDYATWLDQEASIFYTTNAIYAKNVIRAANFLHAIASASAEMGLSVSRGTGQGASAELGLGI